MQRKCKLYVVDTFNDCNQFFLNIVSLSKTMLCCLCGFCSLHILSGDWYRHSCQFMIVTNVSFAYQFMERNINSSHFINISTSLLLQTQLQTIGFSSSCFFCLLITLHFAFLSIDSFYIFVPETHKHMNRYFNNKRKFFKLINVCNELPICEII